MGVKITDIISDKKIYLYWIDKNINLSFKLKSDNKKDLKIKEVYIYYWFNVICSWDKHTIKSEKKSLDKNIILEKNWEKKYNVSIPITIPNNKWYSTEIENFLYIKISNPNQKEKIKPKILFSVKKYEKSKIYNLENYSWLNNYILSDNFENESENDIEKQINEHSNIDDDYSQSEWYDKISLKTSFEWLFSWYFSITDLLPEDYVDDDILNNIKNKSKLFRVANFLLNSEKYWLIYKYIIIAPIIFIVPFFLFPQNYIIWFSFLISFLWFISIFYFSKIIERNYRKILYRNLFDIKLLSSELISNNINNKLKIWNLNINDIFEKFEININHSIDYMFSIRLDSYVQSYSWSWKHVIHETDKTYWIELFHNQWNQIFNINNIKLVKNNYHKLYDILLPTFNKWILNWFNKIYYKIAINFESSYLPKYEKELKINFNKNLFPPRDLIKYNWLYFIVLFVCLPILFWLLYLIYMIEFE